MSDRLKEFCTQEINIAIFGQIDKRIKLCTQPKPKFLPTWIWLKILKRVLVIKYFQSNLQPKSPSNLRASEGSDDKKI